MFPLHSPLPSASESEKKNPSSAYPLVSTESHPVPFGLPQLDVVHLTSGSNRLALCAGKSVYVGIPSVPTTGALSESPGLYTWQRLDGHTAPTTGVVFVPSMETMIVSISGSSRDKVIKAFEEKPPSLFHDSRSFCLYVSPPAPSPLSLCLLPRVCNGRCLAVLCLALMISSPINALDDRTFIVWDCGTGALIYRSFVLSSLPLLSIATDPSLPRIFIGDGAGCVHFVDVARGDYRILHSQDLCSALGSTNSSMGAAAPSHATAPSLPRKSASTLVSVSPSMHTHSALSQCRADDSPSIVAEGGVAIIYLAPIHHCRSLPGTCMR